MSQAVTLSDIFSESSVWTPRFNGMIQHNISGKCAAERFGNQQLKSTSREFIFADKDDKRMDYTFNFERNGYGYGSDKPCLSLKTT